MKNLITCTVIILYLNTSAQIISTIAGNGAAAYAGDGAQATAAKLNNPTGVTFDASNNLYIADYINNRIRKINAAGVITTVVGNGTAGYSGDNIQATAAELTKPFATVFDIAGNMYISDMYNHRIRKVNSSGVITTVAGNGSPTYGGDGGQATAAKIYCPEGMAFDAAGNLYFADQFNHRVRKINTVGIITTVAGTGNAGYSGDNIQATASELYFPSGVTFDATGNLYICDYRNNRIRMVNSSGIITTIAGNGTQAYSGDGGQATTAELYWPTGIAFDATGNLFIADQLNNRIRMKSTSGIITTIAGSGIQSFSGDGGQATSAELSYPIGVAFDNQSCNLYIADYDNNRVRMVNRVCNTSGIEQLVLASNERIYIYPNPNNGNFTIETYSETKQSIQLYDVNGRLVLSQSLLGKTNIDASNLNEGVYSLSIIDNEGTTNKKLVIVK